MRTQVLVAAAPAWESDLARLVGEVREVEVARRCADVAELLSAASAGLGDLAVVSVDLRGLDRDALAHLREHSVRVVGATRTGSESDERVLRQLGVDVVVDLGMTASDVAAALLHGPPAGAADAGALLAHGPDAGSGDEVPESPLAPSPAGPDETLPEEPRESLVVAVWGPTGAPGRTTVAVNLAAELASLGVSSALLDLDTYGASVAQVLGVLDEAPGLAAAARASETGALDAAALARLLVEVTPGLRVLTGIPVPSRWPEVRPAAVEDIIRSARVLVDVVVIDCAFSVEDDEELSYDTRAPRRNGATLTALEHSDRLVVVGAADPVGLQRLVRAVQTVREIPAPSPEVVVNRVRASAVGARPERRIGDALERFAGLDELTFLPDDPAATDAALLAGASLGECAPASRLRSAIAAFAAGLAGVASAEGGVRRRSPRRRDSVQDD